MALKDNWNIDEQIKNNYIEKCKLFVKDNKAFKNFKQDKDYGMILEGNQYEVGIIAEGYLTQRGGWNFLEKYLKQFKENDKIGNPRMDEWLVSPATLRYVNTVWEIRFLLGEHQPKRILEIGGGYGGLCKTLSVLYDFDEYTDKDLPEAEALFMKYTSKFKKLKGKTNTKITSKYDLFIADSSLSECDVATQLYYANLAKDCDYIFMTFNSFHLPSKKGAFDKIKEILKGFHTFKIPPIMTEKGLQDFSITFLARKDKSFI